jgi:glyoxalase family protein
MDLHGIHHVTAVTSNASGNLRYYTEVLGLRLIKKTVNQDDVSAYHLFYADKLGTPGWDMTFFDWAHMPPNQRGTDSIANTMFRVPSRAALEYWAARLTARGLPHGEIGVLAGREVLPFEDPEGQRLALVHDRGAPYEGEPWDGSDVPVEHAIRGFYAVMLSVPRLEPVEALLGGVLGWKNSEQHAWPGRPADTLAVLTMDGGGPGKEVWVLEQPGERPARLGHGGVHHVAFRVPDGQEQRAWNRQLTGAGVSTSGIIDRFYFQSLYFRISRGILFEIATDGPGFSADEPLEELGQRLALPPFLEPQRERIEAGLRPLN